MNCLPLWYGTFHTTVSILKPPYLDPKILVSIWLGLWHSKHNLTQANMTISSLQNYNINQNPQSKPNTFDIGFLYILLTELSKDKYKCCEL